MKKSIYITTGFISDELKVMESETSKKLPLLYALTRKPDLDATSSIGAKSSDMLQKALSNDVVMKEPMLFTSS